MFYHLGYYFLGFITSYCLLILLVFYDLLHLFIYLFFDHMLKNLANEFVRLGSLNTYPILFKPIGSDSM